MTTDPMSVLTGLAALGKVGVEIAAAKDAAQRNALLIEFQQALIQSHSWVASEQIKNASLVSRNQELEQEIVKLKDWSAEREKYELKEVISGFFACVQKGTVGGARSMHKFCAACFEGQRKSPLQQSVVDHRTSTLNCHVCKAQIKFHEYADGS